MSKCIFCHEAAAEICHHCHDGAVEDLNREKEQLKEEMKMAANDPAFPINEEGVDGFSKRELDARGGPVMPVDFLRAISELRDWGRTCWVVTITCDLTVDLVPPITVEVRHLGQVVLHRETLFDALDEQLFSEIVSAIPKAKAETSMVETEKAGPEPIMVETTASVIKRHHANLRSDTIPLIADAIDQIEQRLEKLEAP